jgi:glycosyltransferase involved in cell wall biosynthesis
MHVLILGTRGVPARHGGFETFAEQLARFLIARDHEVTVYCQISAHETPGVDSWNGIRRVLIPASENAMGTIVFDLLAVRHSVRERGVILTLGYNTGVLNFLYRLGGVPNLINMDGIEWKREKWSRAQRAWLWMNEWAAARAGNHLIADHPEIANHLSRHTARTKISTIPYGAETVYSAPLTHIKQFGLSSQNYYILIARPEPENSIREIVQAFSAKRRGIPLVVLGSYERGKSTYQNQVIDAASEEVRFLGSIYDRGLVQSLRYHAKAYFHGHRVGGTNPSLVESLAAGNAVIAHDNPFTRWVAGPGALYFNRSEDLAGTIDQIEENPKLLEGMRQESRGRHQELFTQSEVLSAYEELLQRFAPPEPARADLRGLLRFGSKYIGPSASKGRSVGIQTDYAEELERKNGTSSFAPNTTLKNKR